LPSNSSFHEHTQLVSIVWTGHPCFGTNGSKPFGRDDRADDSSIIEDDDSSIIEDDNPSIIEDDDVCVHATRISRVEI
jgi:hypothetical protein